MQTDMVVSLFRWMVIYVLSATVASAQVGSLGDHLLFYCSFDEGTTADVAVGDPLLYTAKNYKETDAAKPGLHDPDVVLAQNKGLAGDALHFRTKNSAAIYFKGFRNLGYSSRSWSGTCSFWLQLDPDKDLGAGYCDPINLTDVSFDDAALWVDFTDDDPRAFRMGVWGDKEAWKNADGNDEEKVDERVVMVERPSFGNDTWTHVVLSFSEINTNQAAIALYLDGELMGLVKDVSDPFSWNEENAKIMLGLSYIGLLDELAIFDKALDASEVKSVYNHKQGLKTILN